MTKKKVNPILLMIGALSLYFFHTLGSGANPAMAALAEHYAGYPMTTVTWTVTIVMIAAIPTELFGGTIINKMGVRKTIFLGVALALIGGLIPFFTEVGIYALIACRAVVGLAYGLLMPIAYTYINAFYSGDKQSAMLGVGQSVSGLSGILVTALGGWLTAISLRHMYLYHLVVLIPLVLTLFLPEPELSTAEPEKKGKVDFNIGGAAWFFCIMNGVSMMLWYAWPLFSSNIIVGEGLGTSVDAGYVGSVGSAGAMVGGLVYVFAKKVFKKRTYGVAYLGMGLGYLISTLGSNIIFMYVGIFITGMSYFVVVSNCMDTLSICTTPTQYATAVGLSFVCSCLAGQVGSYLLSGIGSIFGRANDFRFYYLVSLIVAAVIGVVLTLRPKKYPVVEAPNA